MNKQFAILIVTLLLFSACNRNDNQPPPKLFNDQIEILDKAKKVENNQLNQDEEQRKAIEKQSQ